MKLKFEHYIILIIIFPVIGVLIWFILDTISVEIAKEIAILITIILFSILIAGALHGKGILPSPNQSLSQVKNGSPKYQRKIFLNAKPYARFAHKNESYIRTTYRGKNK